ncbi:hypothetical protein FRC12_022483 [Ceratobasidium sp. 428]|nr:hypothetical protein FRC12_022483 [Ceratobasidium sp. 428]
MDLDVGAEDAGISDLAYPAADIGPEIGEPVPDDEGLTDEELDALEDFVPTQGIRQNPPVTINNWDAPPSDSDSSEGEDEDGELERDPEYLEHDLPPGLDPIDKPGLTDEEIRRRLNLHLGDLADDEWADMYQRHLSKKDRYTLRLLATRLRTHFSRQTWADLRHGVCAKLKLPSEIVVLTRKYRDLNACPYCQEARRNARGQVRRSFCYTPLTPQLRGLFQSQDMADKLHYRLEAEQDHDPDKIFDVFDGDNYRTVMT